MKDIKKTIKKYMDKLLDFSFKNFVTLGVLRVLYWVNVIIGGLLAALTIRAGFDESAFLGVLAIVFSPIVFGVYLIILRVILEGIAVVFRISEQIKEVTNILENEDNKRKTVDDYEVKDKNKDKNKDE